MKRSLAALGAWLFSWLGQKVNIAIAGVALDGVGDFGPRENSAQLPCCFGLVISVIDVTVM